MQKEQNLRLVRIISGALVSFFKGLLYFLSFLGPVLAVSYFRALPVAVLLGMAIIGFGVAGVVFLMLVVLCKKLLIPSALIPGPTTIDSREGKRFFVSALLSTLVIRSPFRPMIEGLSLFAAWYHRAMGATMPDSVFLGSKCRITDPGLLELGENVSIGGEAVILGHLGNGKEIILGKVAIGDGSVVGARVIIFPDVRIGRDARVGAGAVVVRGTVIGDGETWAGVPARKLSKERTAPS